MGRQAWPGEADQHTALIDEIDNALVVRAGIVGHHQDRDVLGQQGVEIAIGQLGMRTERGTDIVQVGQERLTLIALQRDQADPRPLPLVTQKANRGG